MRLYERIQPPEEPRAPHSIFSLGLGVGFCQLTLDTNQFRFVFAAGRVLGLGFCQPTTNEIITGLSVSTAPTPETPTNYVSTPQSPQATSHPPKSQNPETRSPAKSAVQHSAPPESLSRPQSQIIRVCRSTPTPRSFSPPRVSIEPAARQAPSEKLPAPLAPAPPDAANSHPESPALPYPRNTPPFSRSVKSKARP